MSLANRLRSSFATIRSYQRTVGPRATLEWLLIRISYTLKLRWPSSWCVRPLIVPHHLNVRLRASSDFNVFKQIFVEEEYAPLLDLVGVSFVLDLGANVGYSSTYFLSSYPGAKVVAVEPDHRNVAVCRETLEPFLDRATILHGAAWSHPTRLTLSQGSYGDGREWATQVVQSSSAQDATIQAWDIGTLIEMSGRTTVDLLKIDIERSELEVFNETAREWLPKVRNICIELHGPDCEDAFFQALSPFDYDLLTSGELTICKNLRVRALQLAH